MRRMLVSFTVLVGCAVSSAGADPVSPPVCGESRYYILLFGGQADWRPQTAHTWATFVRATRHPSGITLIDNFTISWLPEKLPVRPFKLRPAPGRNYGLHETLDVMWGYRPTLSLWGPWEISHEWYCQAVEHKAFLDSGAVRFRTLDRGNRRDDLSHCVHAVTKTDPILNAQASPITWYGELVTRRVANAMVDSGMIAQPHATHDWLIAALGLEPYPLTRRRYGEPIIKYFRGPVVSPIASVLGGSNGP